MQVYTYAASKIIGFALTVSYCQNCFDCKAKLKLASTFHAQVDSFSSHLKLSKKHQTCSILHF